ncbi:alpha/beta hydrolase family esterase [Litoreibacter roseus]|uniref:Poly(3-hydroxyalkanoate) depolymerase n=1 Tax=Litoreibacter roseus TaxID=2601869 RepID=A0A6N6JC81_9RHOB|nr:PHB depolymerase family esterase [Litoreibacter roseus]GFE63923.1 poly(3-hydroxyalkanoate) depolymerase [Litoreibacter roseus]
MIRGLAILAAFCLSSAAQAGCNDDGEPCEVDSGTYHIALPENDSATPRPALVFLHGAGGSGRGALRMRTALERGYAVIGPNGLEREGSRFGTGWYFHPDRPKNRDELAFVRSVIADAAARFNIDPSEVLLSGFSIGGSTTSYLACADPSLAKAYAPVAGGFWRPHPEECNGPVKLLHTHGWRDQTVPLEGRPLRGGQIYQGDIFVTLQIWRGENGCDGMRADTFDTDGSFWRRRWDTCQNGALEFALHQGGHGIPPGWSDMALDWFETLD